MEIIDNVNKTFKDNRFVTLRSGSKVAIVASCFSIYAFLYYKRFDCRPSQCENFDGDVLHLDFVDWIVPCTLLAIADGNTLTEQIRIDDWRNKILWKIEVEERQMRFTAQLRRQRELNS